MLQTGLRGGLFFQGTSAISVGQNFSPGPGWKSFTGQAAVPSGSTNVSATLLIQGTNIPNPSDAQFVTLATISLSGSGIVVDGFAMTSPYLTLRGKLNAISGTSAVGSIYIAES